MFPTTKIIPSPDSIQRFSSFITHAIASKNLNLGQTLHSYLIKSSLISETFLSNRLLDLYSKCSCIDSARKAFIDIPSKNTFSWNTLINGCFHNGLLNDAYNLFDEMPEPNIVTYNSMISGLTSHGLHKESITFFKRVQVMCGGLVFDEFTFATMAGACASLGELRFLCQLHGIAVVIGLKFNSVICNALIDAYGKCKRPDLSHMVFTNMFERNAVSWASMVVSYARASRLDDAIRVFSRIEIKDTASWTVLISGLAQNGHGKEALDVFVQMQCDGVRAGPYTYVAVLSVCADLALSEKGKQIHCHVMRSGLENLYVGNALLDAYCKCGDMRSARHLFERMSSKDEVSWNSMINGYALNGQARESINVFRNMIESKLKPNHVTFISVLSACNHCGLLSEGLRILDMMSHYGLQPGSDEYAVLIDLLGRKNRLEEAVSLIERAPDGSDHVAIWGALLGASRVHGNMELARKAAEVLFQLEPGNSGRYTMLSNIYSAAKRWDDADKVRRAMGQRGLKKDTAFSWIDVKNSRHEFVASDKSHFHINEIYEVIHGLVDQMTVPKCRPLVKGSVIEVDELL